MLKFNLQRKRKCKECGNKYRPQRPLQTACSVPCAISLSANSAEKREKKKLAQRREALKTTSDWAKEAQAAFNRYIRERDYDRPCISCGTTSVGIRGWHAGHFRTTKAASQLRYNCWNVNKQCPQCNLHDSGNIASYREGLVQKIGTGRVEQLEYNNSSRRYDIEYLKRIKQIFSKRANMLKRRREER